MSRASDMCVAPAQETYRVYVDWRHGAWTVDIEGVATTRVSHLAAVAAKAQEVIERHRAHCDRGFGLTTKLRLPRSVQARLDLAVHYHTEADQSGSVSYRQGMARAADAARCGAARELIATGMALQDVSALLGISPEQTRELVTCARLPRRP